MVEKPIIFNSEMVRAILDGRKTQTRRVIKPQPPESHEDLWSRKDGVWISTYNEPPHILIDYEIKCPYGKSGDLLWVKETYIDLIKTPVRGAGSEKYKDLKYWYRADNIIKEMEVSGRFISPRFMPKRAARIWLKVTDVRVERLQDISEEDAVAEGCPNILHGTDIQHPEIALRGFRLIWDLINKKRGYPWESNPWIWVIEFESCTTSTT